MWAPAEGVTKAYALPSTPFSGNYRVFSNPKEAHEWGKDLYEDWADSLADHERHGLEAYKGHDYAEINMLLRHGRKAGFDRSDVDTYRPFIAGLDSALQKSKVWNNLTAYRAMESPEISEHWPNVVGRQFIDKGYVSTSLHPEGARKHLSRLADPVFAEIRIPGGHRGAYIEAAVPSQEREYELLLPRMSEFKVVNADERHIGNQRVKYVTLEAL